MTVDTYSHVVAVDVIWSHDVRMSGLQDDPGVIDLWKQVDGGKRALMVPVITVKMWIDS